AHPVDGRVERGHDDAFGHAVSVDKFLDYLLAVFDVNVGAETELLCHSYILTAGMPSAQTKRRERRAQQATSFTSISDGGSAPNCFFCRLGKLHGDEELFWI